MSKRGIYSCGVCAICLFFVFTPLLAQEQPAIPQQVQEWQKAAQSSVKEKDIPKAISCYEQIVQSFPNTSYALDAQTQIICLEIKTMQKDKVQTDIQLLEQNYSSQSGYLKAIETIGNQYRKNRKRDEALALYEETLRQFPGREDSIFLKQGVVEMYLEKKKRADADSALESLMSQYGGVPDYARAIFDIATKYRTEAEDYAEGRTLYTHLLERFGNDEDAWRYQNGIAKTYLEEGDMGSADREIELLLSQYSHPDMARHVVDLGWIYLKIYQRPDKAIELCNRLFKQFPNTPQSARIQSLLVTSHLQKGNDEQAEKEMGVLLDKYSSYPDFVKTIQVLSEACRKYKQYAKVVELQRALLGRASGPEQIIPTTGNLAAAMILNGDFIEGQVVTDNLQKDFAGRAELGSALNVIGDAWREMKQYDKALALYDTILQIRAGTKDETNARMGTALVYMKLGQDDRVMTEVDKLIAEAGSLPEADDAIFDIGEEYYNNAFVNGKQGRLAENSSHSLNKAIEIWQKPAYPEGSEQKVEAMYLSATAYLYMKQYDAAIETYRKILDLRSASGYAQAGNILGLIGRCYEGMAQEGLGDPNQAMASAESAWRTVVEKYPDEPMSFDAAMRLAIVKEGKGQWTDAAEAYEFFLSHCGNDIRKVQTTFKLGNAYERAGQKDLAREVYSKYVQMAPVGDRYIPQAAKALLRLAGVGQ